jgi:hypothetical protein
MTRVSLKEDMFEKLWNLVYYQDGKVYNKFNDKSYGSLCKNGYMECSIKIDNDTTVRCYLHRLVFLLNFKYLPNYVDHINGDKTDNHIENLRDVTQSINGHNCKLSKNNKSGVNGVYYDKTRSKWSSSIKIGYKKIGFSRFSTLEAAIEHRNSLERLYKDEIGK